MDVLLHFVVYTTYFVLCMVHHALCIMHYTSCTMHLAFCVCICACNCTHTHTYIYIFVCRWLWICTCIHIHQYWNHWAMLVISSGLCQELRRFGPWQDVPWYIRKQGVAAMKKQLQLRNGWSFAGDKAILVGFLHLILPLSNKFPHQSWRWNGKTLRHNVQGIVDVWG